jgi:hypothetical protein
MFAKSDSQFSAIRSFVSVAKLDDAVLRGLHVRTIPLARAIMREHDRGYRFLGHVVLLLFC